MSELDIDAARAWLIERHGQPDCGAANGFTNEVAELMAAFLAEKTPQIRADADKWRLALESLTAQGSEFVNDLDRCVEYVRNRYNERHEALKANVKLRRENEELKRQVAKAEAVKDIDSTLTQWAKNAHLSPDQWNSLLVIIDGFAKEMTEVKDGN